jgi:release factor glutamine methyltransferase
MTRPSFINEVDFKLLQEKYKDELLLNKEIEKIRNDYPIQYSIGYVEFLRNRINVDERALIPRFETEIIVDSLINKINNLNLGNSNMIDLCTGSGCIAISLKKNFINSKIDAIDISEDALSLANENAKINNVCINFEKKDILNDFIFNKKYSVLVSNPPYVRLSEYVSNNTKFEPYNALYAGEDNLIFYKKILSSAKEILTEKFIICLELNALDSKEIYNIAKKEFPFSNIFIEKDYSDLDRSIFIIND